MKLSIEIHHKEVLCEGVDLGSRQDGVAGICVYGIESYLKDGILNHQPSNIDMLRKGSAALSL
jgi:hypothetical protein